MEEIKKYKVVWIAILLSLIVEIFVCNYGFFRTLFAGNQKNDVIYTIEDNNTVRINDIDQRVTCISFRYRKPLYQNLTYQIKIATEDKRAPTALQEKTIPPKERQYIQLDSHSNCNFIEVKITGEDVAIDSIQINKPIFQFNVLRIVLLFLGALFFLKIKDGSLLKNEYDENSKKQKRMDIGILAGLCVAILVYVTIQVDPNHFVISPTEVEMSMITDHVDCLSLQVEAWMNGKMELMIEPSKDLKELSNPYDITLRKGNQVTHLYDVAYYNGKYYNYFGVTPILTSILPFRILTGNYLHLYLFNMLYVWLGIFALYALYRKLIHRYIHKVSRFNFLLGFFALLFASNFLILMRGRKYDITVASGIAFLLVALNLAISIQKKTKYRWIKLVLLGISTGLVVLARPNFILYYPLIVFFFWKSIKGLDKKEKIKSISIAMIPLVLLGIFQMILNYLRFDNILEFGAKYQLTIDDMRYSMGVTFGKILEGFSSYFGKMPNINLLKFPFFGLSTGEDRVVMNEQCYELPLIGFAFIPIFYIYLFAKEILKNSKEKELKHFIILSAITVAIMIIITTCCGGVMESYSVDLKLILAIGAVLLMLKALEQKEGQKWINKAFHIVCMITIIMMIPIVIFTHLNVWEKQPITAYLENTFEFWT